MRRTIAFIALWFVAGAAAATVAWLGVSTVSDQLAGSGSHPDPLSSDEIAAEVASVSTTTTTVPGPTTTTTPPTATTVEPGGTATTGTTLDQAPTTPTSPPTTAAPSPAPAPVVRSYDLVGGSTTLRFTAGGVTVVVATPKPGFTVDVGESHSGGARVEFESDGHRSRVDGWWDGGPQDEVREDD